MLMNITSTAQQHSSVLWINRIALFIVFFWFGLLKIIGLSPAEGIVTQLHHQTLEHIISVQYFMPLLGVIECVIGLIWLVPQYTPIAFCLFCCQMTTTFLPLLLMPNETWQSTFALSLSGQYIIKNVVLIASAYTIYRACHWENKI